MAHDDEIREKEIINFLKKNKNFFIKNSMTIFFEESEVFFFDIPILEVLIGLFLPNHQEKL